MSYIPVEELRRWLNLNFSEDDLLLAELIEASENVVEQQIMQPLSDLEDASGELPAGLKTAIKEYAATLYENREAVAYGSPNKIPYTFEYLIQPFKKYKK